MDDVFGLALLTLITNNDDISQLMMTLQKGLALLTLNTTNDDVFGFALLTFITTNDDVSKKVSTANIHHY